MRPEAGDMLSVLMQSLGKGITVVSSSLLNVLTGIASVVPSLFLKTIVTIIATVFITIDFEKIKNFLVRQIPDGKRKIFAEARVFFGGTIVKCFLSYMAILFITFIELALGFTLLRIPYALLLAALIAVVDILPVLNRDGSGTLGSHFAALGRLWYWYRYPSALSGDYDNQKYHRAKACRKTNRLTSCCDFCRYAAWFEIFWLFGDVWHTVIDCLYQ